MEPHLDCGGPIDSDLDAAGPINGWDPDACDAPDLHLGPDDDDTSLAPLFVMEEGFAPDCDGKRANPYTSAGLYRLPPGQALLLGTVHDVTREGESLWWPDGEPPPDDGLMDRPMILEVSTACALTGHAERTLYGWVPSCPRCFPVVSDVDDDLDADLDTGEEYALGAWEVEHGMWLDDDCDAATLDECLITLDEDAPPLLPPFDDCDDANQDCDSVTALLLLPLGESRPLLTGYANLAEKVRGIGGSIGPSRKAERDAAGLVPVQTVIGGTATATTRPHRWNEGDCCDNDDCDASRSTQAGGSCPWRGPWRTPTAAPPDVVAAVELLVDGERVPYGADDGDDGDDGDDAYRAALLAHLDGSTRNFSLSEFRRKAGKDADPDDPEEE